MLTGPQLSDGNVTLATCSESRISSMFTSNMVVVVSNSFYLEFNYYLDECGGGGQLSFVFQSEGYNAFLFLLSNTFNKHFMQESFSATNDLW